MLKYNIGKNGFVAIEEELMFGGTNRMSIDYTFNNRSEWGSIKEEYINILNSIGEDVYILYSGGVDSEAVLEAAMESDIKFTAVTMRYVIDDIYMNDHDYNIAKKYCELHNIVHKIIDLNLTWFFDEDNYIPYSAKYNCISPQLCCHLWLIDELDKFCIMGGDLLTIKQNQLTSYGYKYTCYDRYFYLNNRPGISNLGLYAPEVMLATMQLYPALRKRYRYTGIVDYVSKCLVYKLGGFNLEQKIQKFTGFEEIKQYYSDKYNEVGTLRTFDNMFRKPLEGRVAVVDELQITYPDQIITMLGE